MYIKDILNKIKWSKNNINKYKLYYYDRLLNNKVDFGFKDIKEVSENFIKINGKEIPLHRIREIRKNGRLVWER